jgi:translocation and assembly module TamB
MPAAREEWPGINNVTLDLNLAEEAAEVEALRFEILEQPVEMTAHLPLGEEVWAALRRKDGQLDWHDLSARLRIERAKLSGLAKYFPSLLSPQGELSANIVLQPEARLGGGIEVRDLGTRPLGALGPVHDVDALVRLNGRRIELKRLEAFLGGQRVDLSGDALLPQELWPQDALPMFRLALRGTNLPLARRPELMLRADVNLTISNSPAQPPPTVTGTVTLRNSYFVSDLRALVPGKIARPEQRPPYFSIDKEPFGNWRLNVEVRGDDFLKVRSPIFRGAISSTLRLDGTLGEPVALGEVRVSSGTIQFPFANFEVTEGLVSITSADPHEPRLFVTAAAERLGYNLKLEVTGPATDPRLQFSSSPPLSPEQILLMVTAGQAPAQAGQLSTEQRAQRLGLFVGRSLLSSLGVGAGSEDRLTIQSGEQVTQSGKPTYEVEYKLTDDWSIVGEYDRFNEFNVGVKWKVLSR